MVEFTISKTFTVTLPNGTTQDITVRYDSTYTPGTPQQSGTIWKHTVTLEPCNTATTPEFQAQVSQEAQSWVADRILDVRELANTHSGASGGVRGLSC